jgi:hypothetical protein
MKNPPVVRWASPRDGEVIYVGEPQGTADVMIIIDVWDGPPSPTNMPKDVYLEVTTNQRAIFYGCPNPTQSVEACWANASSLDSKHDLTFTASQLPQGTYKWTVHAVSQATRQPVHSETITFSVEHLPLILEGEGLSRAIAGVPTSFVMRTSALETANFTVRLEGPSLVSAEVVINGGGTFDVSYYVVDPGSYNLRIFLEHHSGAAMRDPGDLSLPFGFQGIEVQGSPFAVTVEPSSLFVQPRQRCNAHFEAGAAAVRASRHWHDAHSRGACNMRAIRDGSTGRPLPSGRKDGRARRMPCSVVRHRHRPAGACVRACTRTRKRTRARPSRDRARQPRSRRIGRFLQGRWVHRSTELVRSLYSAGELVQLALQWVWIPHTCQSPVAVAVAASVPV